MTVEVLEKPDEFPLWTMVMVEEAWPTRDPDRIAGALTVLEKIYPDTLGKKMNKSMIFDWPDLLDYEPQPCPVCHEFHVYDDTVLIGELVEEEWPTYDRLPKVPILQGGCPTCGSPDPMKHPNVLINEGTLCGDPYHDPDATVVRRVPISIDENARRQLQYYEGLPT